MKFTDNCYPPELVEFINNTLDDPELTAMEMWWQICEAENMLYGDQTFQGLPWQLCLETAPREFLISIILERRVPGYEELMRRFNVVLPGYNFAN